jgi:hypothetical protein
MRLLSRLDDERKSGAIWYANFRQSPKNISMFYCRGILCASDPAGEVMNVPAAPR